MSQCMSEATVPLGGNEDDLHQIWPHNEARIQSICILQIAHPNPCFSCIDSHHKVLWGDLLAVRLHWALLVTCWHHVQHQVSALPPLQDRWEDTPVLHDLGNPQDLQSKARPWETNRGNLCPNRHIGPHVLSRLLAKVSMGATVSLPLVNCRVAYIDQFEWMSSMHKLRVWA